MDNNQFPGHPLLALVYAFASALLGIFAAFLNHIDLLVRLGAGVAAVAAAFMACRYHYYATKEKIQSLKKLKEDK